LYKFGSLIKMSLIFCQKKDRRGYIYGFQLIFWTNKLITVITVQWSGGPLCPYCQVENKCGSRKIYFRVYYYARH